MVIALHLLLVAVAIRTAPAAAPPPALAAAMTVRAIAAPPREQPEPTPDLPLDPGLAEPIVTVAATTPSAAVPCDVLERIGRAVAADPATIDALGSVAAGTTRAIMVWDGHWSTVPEALPVRRAAVAALISTDPECLDEILTGPRLIFVSVATTTVSIAVGSGRWTWHKLLSSGQYN